MDPNPTPTTATAASTERLVKLIAVAALVVMIGLGWLMVSNHRSDADARAECLYQRTAGGFISPACR